MIVLQPLVRTGDIRVGGYVVIDVPLQQLRDWCKAVISMIDEKQS